MAVDQQRNLPDLYPICRAHADPKLLLSGGDVGNDAKDAALVGAVDLCCEPVHRIAAEVLLPADRQISGDAAVVLVLKREADALSNGDRVIATLTDIGEKAGLSLGPGSDGADLTSRTGHAAAAAFLVDTAAALVAIDRGILPDGAAWPADEQGHRLAEVLVDGHPPLGLRGNATAAEQPAQAATGRALVFPAHPPPVRIPSPPANDSQDHLMPAQIMDPAPPLAPVSSATWHNLAPREIPTFTAQTTTPDSMPTAAAADPSTDPLFGRYQEHIAQLGHLQQEFVEPNRSVTRIQFEGIQINGEIKDSLFTVKLPPDVDRVRG